MRPAEKRPHASVNELFCDPKCSQCRSKIPDRPVGGADGHQDLCSRCLAESAAERAMGA